MMNSDIEATPLPADKPRLSQCRSSEHAASIEVIATSGVATVNRLARFEHWLAKKCGTKGVFETQGAKPVDEQDKRPPSIFSACLLWPSIILHLGMVPLGLLGPGFGLDFKRSIICSVVATCIGALFPAFASTLGPKLGMRQMVVARYTFGYWGVKLTAVFMLLSSISFVVINCVVAGEALSAVSDFRISIVVGCVLLVVVSYIPNFFGFRIVMAFETFAWIAGLIIFAALYAQLVPEIDINTPPRVSGRELSAAWLSFFCIQFSNAAGWAVMASDFSCNYLQDTNTGKVFALTWTGVVVPLVFINLLSIIIGQAIFAAPDGRFAEAYASHGLGGVLLIAWHPEPWAKFALVVCFLTTLGNNIGIAYSAGFSAQLMGRTCRMVPRFIWSLLVYLISLALAALGRESLSSIVSNFLSLLGYWIVPFTMMLLIEDKFFRRNEGYDMAAWDTQSELPLGIAAIFTFLAAFLGAFPGISQSWFVGPVAAQLGESGGDVGIFLAFAITCLLYPPTRWIEKKITRR